MQRKGGEKRSVCERKRRTERNVEWNWVENEHWEREKEREGMKKKYEYMHRMITKWTDKLQTYKSTNIKFQVSKNIGVKIIMIHLQNGEQSYINRPKFTKLITMMAILIDLIKRYQQAYF